MTQGFIIADNGRFTRILLFVILLHLILLLGSTIFPIKLLALKPKMTSLFEVSQKTTLNIAPRQQPSLTLQKPDFSSPHTSQSLHEIPRRKVISAASHSPKESEYLAKWQAYVEKYGNAHYPKAILNSHLQGNLRLMVAINRDGSLHEVTIRQSSGSAVLDQAAINIVLKAAPFDPLPPEITDETDVLEIIRTWEFRGKLSTSNL